MSSETSLRFGRRPMETPGVATVTVMSSAKLRRLGNRLCVENTHMRGKFVMIGCGCHGDEL